MCGFLSPSLYLMKYTSGLLGGVGGDFGTSTNGWASGFFTNTYTKVLCSSGVCSGSLGARGVGGVGAFMKMIL